MLEISPVLAGIFDTPTYTPTPNNIGTAPDSVTSSTAAVDPTDSSSATSPSDVAETRRYTKFDRTAADAGSADFTFGDFVDMVNPLQHIPVVSSIYRSVTGSQINPVSRVAGDLLYGALGGGISALAAGAGALGNTLIETQTGHDATGTAVAALFGPGNNQASGQATTQLASANAPAVNPLASSSAMIAAAAQARAQAPTPVASAILAASNSSSPLGPAASLATMPSPSASSPLNAIGAAPPNKLPYGGVLDPGTSLDSQNTAIALAQTSHGMRMGHTIYTTGFASNGRVPPLGSIPSNLMPAPSTAAAASSTPANVALSNTAAALPGSAAIPSTNSLANNMSMSHALSGNAAGAQHNPIPDALVNDMVMMKGLNQYRNIAGGSTPSPGSVLDITN